MNGPPDAVETCLVAAEGAATGVGNAELQGGSGDDLLSAPRVGRRREPSDAFVRLDAAREDVQVSVDQDGAGGDFASVSLVTPVDPGGVSSAQDAVANGSLTVRKARPGQAALDVAAGSCGAISSWT